MEHPDDEFRKLLQQVMNETPLPKMEPEEIHFDQLAMEVMELVGNRWVVWNSRILSDISSCHPDNY